MPKERHRTGHIGWLRAAVLGANDGILSTASLVLGVAAAHGTRSNILVAGVAGLCRWPPVSTFLSTRRQITLIQVNVIAITQDAISLHAKIAHIAERHRRAVRLLGVRCHERLIRTNIRKRPDYRRMLPFRFESHR
jgi:hypothetical protein